MKCNAAMDHMVIQRPENTASLDFEKGSFRDRTSRVLIHNDQVFRVLDHNALQEWHNVREKDFYKKSVEDNHIINSEERELSEFNISNRLTHKWEALLEHERIPFISYPYEWSFEMLKDAALLHLDLLSQALAADIFLKDSTPYNIQWRGSSPAFIDTASFIKLPKGSAWTGYRQFCELFLFPLMLQSYKGLPFQPWLRGSLEGIDATDMRSTMSFRDLFRPGVLMHVVLQAKLQDRYNDSSNNAQQTLKKAGFNKELIIHNVNNLKRLVNKLQWGKSRSTWSNYVNENNYSNKDMEEKKSFVRKITSSKKYNTVWDLGCNTGTFSLIAADNAEHVVAIDYDPLTIDHLYQSLKKTGNTKILPLIGNLADPSPGIGWRNMERKPLLERGKPDLIMGLALIHHLVIAANIPLDEAIHWLAELGGDLLIEYVDKSDSMTQKLLLNKEDHYSDYTQENFEQLLGKYFSSIEKTPLNSGTRILYLAQH